MSFSERMKQKGWWLVAVLNALQAAVYFWYAYTVSEGGAQESAEKTLLIIVAAGMFAVNAFFIFSYAGGMGHHLYVDREKRVFRVTLLVATAISAIANLLGYNLVPWLSNVNILLGAAGALTSLFLIDGVRASVDIE